MYSVMISTGGGLFIISLLDIKIEIESRCQMRLPWLPGKCQKLPLFQYFPFQCVIFLFVIKVDTRLKWQIEVFTMPHPLRTFH